MLHSDYDMDACEQEFYNEIESMYCKRHLRIDVWVYQLSHEFSVN